MSCAAAGIDLAQRPVERRQIDHVAAQVVRLRSLVRCFQAADEHLGHVIDVLQILPAAVGDVIGPAQGQRLDRLGRLAGHAEIAADAVDRPRPQADAGQAVVLEVDAGVALVAALEVAVMRGRRQRHVVGQRARRIVLRRPEHGGGAGVDQPLHLALPTARTASKTASVPRTLTLAPSSGSARQIGTCKPARWTMCVMLCCVDGARAGPAGR